MLTVIALILLFIGQLSDLFDQLTLLDMQFVIVGVHITGQLNQHVTDVCA